MSRDSHQTLETRFTVPAVAEAVAHAIPDREYIVHGARRHTYTQTLERSNRLAAYLHSRGLGCHTERSGLHRHQVGQDLLGIYAYNGVEFVESILGSFRARVAPFNVNYRYTKAELLYLLEDSGATALVYHSALAPALAEVLSALPRLRVLIQIADSSGNPLLEGAVDYESLVEQGPAEPPPVQPSPDDLYILYTGGTTGMPKGVLWRQHDIFMSAFGGRDLTSGEPAGTLPDLVARAAASTPTRLLVLPPLMHGAAQWAVMCALTTGQTVVFPPLAERFEPMTVLSTIEREKVFVATIVGDAMARPLAEAMHSTDADLSSLVVIGNGGARLTPSIKQSLIDARPGLIVLDGVGSSETGAQLTHMSMAGSVSTGRFIPGRDTCVLSEDLDAVLPPGHEGIGWLAQRGWVPLGYLGDEQKTEATFPVLGYERYAVPGDRARHVTSDEVELLGRDSATINSGGEKIFAEEVEMALASHPLVADVVVTSRESDRWGQEVVAVVALAADAATESADLMAHAAQSLARYKLPKAIVYRAAIKRSPAGKADYVWAKAQAAVPSDGPQPCNS
ncbi:acyl-CoA synthetase [Mycobacterium sp. CPCC 205372]|uniref:Acyl-CoA synthetase n=1 Tax=Mycobacterium hippophais TaxID=3016340 RepID=A0ABT4PLC7_9MYCO|nr:acyl-CoA synthetase [Mycobacterium hippophais]MCZ8377356.1 acyl-CoA synthetase [Mycobacterium hippophais]